MHADTAPLEDDAPATAGSTDATRPEDVPAVPVYARERLRLLLLAGLAAVWAIPVWAQARVVGAVVEQSGGTRTGLLAAGSLLAVWGLASTSLAARRLRGLRVGMALVAALIAGVTTWLLATEHAWIPGGAMRAGWTPVFGCLALMALIEAIVALRNPLAGPELAWLRALAGLVAAGGLYVAGALLPAGVALWIGATAVVNARIETAVGARRAIEIFVLIAAILAGFAPSLHARIVDLPPPISDGFPQYAWVVMVAVLATTAVDGVFRPAADLDDDL